MSLRALKPWHVAFALAVLVAVMVALWPMGLGRDYMNHLARTFIQANIGSDPSLQQFYSVSFDFIPDLTMDLIIPWLSKIVGIYAAGGFTVWLAFVLPPLAGIALAKTLHGKVTWISLVGFLAVFNGNMDFGFVNYTASSGLALFAFVLWIRMTPGWRRLVVFFPVSLFLVVNHALAFLTFGFLALAWEIASFARDQRGGRWKFVRQLVFIDFPAMIGALVFLGLSMRSATDLPQGIDPLYDLPIKFQALFAATQFQNQMLAVAIAALTIAFFGLALREGWLTFASKMGGVCGAFLVLVVLVPTAIFGIWGLHLRFTAPLLIVAAASVQITPSFEKTPRQIASGGFALMIALAFANGGFQMAKLDGKADTLKPVLAHLPEGAKVLNVFESPEVDSAFTSHAASIAVIERSAFIPNLFTNTSPVDVARHMADLHMPQALPVLALSLPVLANRPAAESQNGYWSQEFADAWPDRWEYLLVFKTPAFSGLHSLPVCEVSATPEIILYKTEPCT